MAEIVRELRDATDKSMELSSTGVHHQPRTFSSENIQIPFNNAQLHSCPSKVYGGSRSRCSGPELTHRYKVSVRNPITIYYGKVLANGFTVEVSKNVNRSIGHTVEILSGFAQIDLFISSGIKSKSSNQWHNNN